MNEDVFPVEHGDIPASYVSLPEGKKKGWLSGFQVELWILSPNRDPNHLTLPSLPIDTVDGSEIR